MSGEGTPAALDFYGLLRALREQDVEFVVIGAFALGFHGVARGTKDVDIVPDPTPANIGRLWEALRTLDASPAEHAEFRLEEMPVSITMKEEAGRPQDLIDIQALRMAEGLEE